MVIGHMKIVNKNESLENDFGMTLIGANKMLPVESLKFNRQYQRSIQPTRRDKIKISMVKCGHFLPDQSITVNQDYEIVDGQHRYLAAKELGMTHIPVTVYNFSDKEKEAGFFIHINGFDQRLSQIDYWYGRFLSGCPLAQFMYYLEQSSASALRGKIVVKGAATKTRISVPITLNLLLHCAAPRMGIWRPPSEEACIKKIMDVGVGVMLPRVNELVNWIESVYGTRAYNPVAYRRDSMQTILFVHNQLSNMGIVNDRPVINKLKSFEMGTTFITAPLVGKNFQIIDHFNKGRTKNRIPYSLDKE